MWHLAWRLTSGAGPSRRSSPATAGRSPWLARRDAVARSPRPLRPGRPRRRRCGPVWPRSPLRRAPAGSAPQAREHVAHALSPSCGPCRVAFPGDADPSHDHDGPNRGGGVSRQAETSTLVRVGSHRGPQEVAGAPSGRRARGQPSPTGTLVPTSGPSAPRPRNGVGPGARSVGAAGPPGGRAR